MSDSSFDPLWGGEAIAADLFPNTKPDEQKAVLRKTFGDGAISTTSAGA
jgi:hypothetical protein